MKRAILCLIILLTLGVAFGVEYVADPQFKLTDPVATPQTKALYQNLHKLAQNNILFGHQDTLSYGMGWEGTAETFDSDVYRVCGKFPAVFGWDLGHIGDANNIDGVPFENMKIWMAEGYKRGGVNTISWHARIPGSDKNAWTQEAVVSRILPGGDLHQEYVAKLELIAKFIGDLKGPEGEPIPVIFRPFHEHNGSWFWWGAKWCTPEQYKQIWQFTVDYLRKTKGLHNIITCYSPDRFENRDEYLVRYPGDDYIDILAHDNYGSFSSLDKKVEAQKMIDMLVTIANEHNKVAALSETGLERIPNPNWWTDVLLEIIKTSDKGKQLAWVLVWRNGRPDHYYAPYPGQTSAENFKKFEADPFTLFMGDLPKMYE